MAKTAKGQSERRSLSSRKNLAGLAAFAALLCLCTTPAISGTVEPLEGRTADISIEFKARETAEISPFLAETDAIVSHTRSYTKRFDIRLFAFKNEIIASVRDHGAFPVGAGSQKCSDIEGEGFEGMSGCGSFRFADGVFNARLVLDFASGGGAVHMQEQTILALELELSAEACGVSAASLEVSNAYSGTYIDTDGQTKSASVKAQGKAARAGCEFLKDRRPF